MKDLAAELGVSVVTISKVLRNHSDISQETKDRVLKRMRELNYRPNLAARALVTGRTSAIGFVVPDLVHPFFAEVAKGLSKVFRARGYSLLIASSEEEPDLEKQEIDQMLARQVDALVIASTQWSAESFARIEEHGTPYVLIDRSFKDHAANFVGIDDVKAGLLATGHLIATGRRRIAHLRGPLHSTGAGRLEGYRQALAAHAIEVPESYVIAGRYADANAGQVGYEGMQQLLACNPRPDAVFCYNDPSAMGALRAILEAGLRIPEDIAVASCGNVHYADFLRVPLTSVDQNSFEIGTRAASLALELVDAKSAPPPRTELVEPRLVVRASSSGH
jgi:LacI family transcriptional regulator